MQKTNLWNSFRLLCSKVILIGILLAFSLPVKAQFWSGKKNRGDKPYYFGITLGFNQTYLKMDYNEEFLNDETLLNIQPIHTEGLSLGLLGNLELIDHLDLRLNPALHFSQKDLQYDYKQSEEMNSERKKLEFIGLTVPLQLRLKSEKVGNFRAYLLGGVKMEKDFAANSADRTAEDIIKLRDKDLGYEAGIGVEFFLPYFILSPEIKISYGTKDVHLREPTNMYSTPVGRLISRMIVFSLHFEG